MNTSHELKLKVKAVFKYVLRTNPYKPLAKLIGYLFYPLTYFSWVKRDVLPILKLINDLFVNSIVSTFLSFWYPLILIMILGRVASAHYLVPSIASIVPIVVGVQVMPSIIISLRNSSILKRIGATNTRTTDLSLAIIFYFSVVSFISLTINSSFGFVLFYNDINFSLFRWGDYFIANLIGVITSVTFGMLIAGNLKKEQTALLVGLLLTLPGAFLSAQFLTPSVVNDWGPVRYIAFIFPQKIVAVLSHAATNNHSVFNISSVISTNFDALERSTNMVQTLTTNGLIANAQLPAFNQWIESLKNKFEVVNRTEMIMAWVLAPVEIITFATLTTLTFKWGIR